MEDFSYLKLDLASSSAAIAASRVTPGKSSRKLGKRMPMLKIISQILKWHTRAAKYRSPAHNFGVC
jgi:hypothetical protein